MIIGCALIVSALSSVVVAGYGEIRHLELNGDHLIETSPTNYGITSSLTRNNHWETVSVNGNEFQVITSTCQTVTKNLNSLTDAEKTLLNNARSQIQSINNPNYRPASGQFRYSFSRYSSNGGQSSSSGNIIQSSYNNNGISMSKNDDLNFTLAKSGLPNNLARIFAHGNVVTFVHNDGSVKSKPLFCLKPEEQQIIEQSRLSLHQAEQQFKQNMMQFDQNMRNMQHGLNNMFGNGFPFNQMNNGQVMNQNNLAMNQHQYPFQLQQQLNPSQAGMQSGNFMNGFGTPNMPYNMYNPFASNFMRPNPQPFGNQFPFGPVNSPFG